MIPEFDEKLSLGAFSHVAALGDGTPDQVEWSSVEFLSELDRLIETDGFEASTGLEWTKNSGDDVVLSSQSQLSLVAFEFSVAKPTQLLLSISAPQGVAWYYEDHNGDIHHHVDNYRQPMAAREVFDIRPAIPLLLEPGHTYRLLIVTFVFTPGSAVSFDLWQPESFREQRTAFHFSEGMFFGFVATLATASLVAAIVLRQLALLFFAGFIASGGVAIYIVTGFSLLFGVGSRVDLSVSLLTVAYYATALFANLFGMYFLDMWNTHRKLYWVYFGLLIYVLAVGLQVVFAGASAASLEIAIVLTGLSIVIGQAAHLYALVYYFNRNRYVLYWWMGMTLYSGSMIVLAVSTAGPIQVELAGRSLSQIAMVLNALLMLVLLLYHFKLEQNSRRSAQQSSMENLRLARDLEKSRSNFVSTVGHELGAPVQAIRHFSESLKPSATESSRQVLGKIDGNLVKISELLDSLINLSRIDWQSAEPSLEAVAVRPLLLELRSEFLGKAAEKNLELAIEMTDCAALSDRVCLSQILRNLIENAIKYTEKGYVRVRVIEMASTVTIVVEDSGVGIAREDLNDIFGEFYRVDDDAESTSGVGLGLSIVSRLARLLRIDIKVSSTLGEGSQFAIEIDKSEMPVNEERVSGAVLSGMSKGTVALVSQKPETFKDIADLLRSWGLQVIITQTMPDALVDLIILETAFQGQAVSDGEVPRLIVESDITPIRLRRLVQRHLNPQL